MATTFKFHVQHGSDSFRKGIGQLHVEEETIRLELPTTSEKQIQISPAIRNVRLCDTSRGLKEMLQTWTLPTCEIDLSRFPMFLAFALIILMVPVPTTLPWESVFKGIAIAGCFFYCLVVPLVRLLIEFEDDTYVCGDIAESILEVHHTQIFR
ncbi:hypothetical protein F4054_04780 [Candidatus Poribacteria bacterium]|nr:hypothetical protein [Candidatus Poribacteria bacterium]MYK21558.1 hypothetical protein [Candidatus Poribacteria bacterium]